MARAAEREPNSVVPRNHPVAAATSFDEIAAWVGEEPTGGLVGAEPVPGPRSPVDAEDTAAYRTARWLLGGVATSGSSMTQERTRDLAERLQRLADAFD